MLLNFEEYTHELTEIETQVAKAIHTVITSMHGQPITAKQIITRFKTRSVEMFPGFRLDEARVRKMINFICNTKAPNLIGTSKGYFITDDVDQLKRAAITLRSRANENERRSEIIFKHLSERYGVRHG